MKLNRKNKLLINTICAFLFFMTSAFSVEWGGIIKNDTQFLLPEFNNFSLSQSDSIYLWLTSPLGKNGLYFSGEGMYGFTLSAGDGSTTFANKVDVDLLKISGDFELTNGHISVSAGRYMVIDSTAAIFAQNFDGVSLKYTGRRFVIAGFGGYTGLLNALNVSMLNKDGYVFGTENDFYSLANAFIPAGVTFELPSLFTNQSVSIQTLAVIDAGEEKYNRFYGTLLLSGPMTNNIFYNLATSFGTNSFSSVMNYSVLNLYIYPSNIMSVSFGAEYASGNNAFLSPFVGVTSRKVASSLSAPETSGVIIPNAVCSFVLNRVYVGLVGKFVMAVPESKVEAKGVEADLSFVYAPFNDFQIGFDINSYFDISKSNDNNFSATLRAALSF